MVRAFTLLVVAFLAGSIVSAQEAASFDEAERAHRQAVAGITDQVLQANGLLAKNFRQALERNLPQLSAADHALASEEIARLENGDRGKSALGGVTGGTLGELKARYDKARQKLSEDYQKEIASSNALYRRHLEALAESATGDERARIVAQLSKLGSAVEDADLTINGVEVGYGEGSFYLSMDELPEGGVWDLGVVKVLVEGKPTVVEGKKKKALRFATRFDYLEVKRFNPTSSFTLSSWVKMDKIKPWSMIFKCAETNQTGDTLHLGMGGAQLKPSINVEGSVSVECREKVIKTGVWVHVVGTYKDGEFARLYIDGQLMGEAYPTEPMPEGNRLFARIAQGINSTGGIIRSSDTGALLGSLDEFVYLPHSIDDAAALKLFQRAGGAGSNEE